MRELKREFLNFKLQRVVVCNWNNKKINKYKNKNEKIRLHFIEK